MIGFVYVLIFASVALFIYAFFGGEAEERPSLRAFEQRGQKKSQKSLLGGVFKKIAVINKPLCHGPLGKRIAKDLHVAGVEMSPAEFFLIKEILMVFLFLILTPRMTPETTMFFFAVIFVGGYMLPEFWLQGKVKKRKDEIIRELPDVVDLLALCVNAGLDFMLAMKWVIEKSRPSALIEELNLVMQEINVGKPRREALRDLAKKYELPDLSTFSRTLIQADRMGTSIGDALNILSEDMRMVRFRRGEKIALKAPIKLLVPLLLFIFPVVIILVGAPIILDFLNRNTTGAFGALMGK